MQNPQPPPLDAGLRADRHDRDYGIVIFSKEPFQRFKTFERVNGHNCFKTAAALKPVLFGVSEHPISSKECPMSKVLPFIIGYTLPGVGSSVFYL